MLTTAPPPVPWRAKPLLVDGCVTMLAGREGQGKSMLALALAAAIGDGATVAGIECGHGRTLIADAENGEPEAWRRVYGLGVRPGTLLYVEANGFNLRDDFDELEALIAEHEPAVVVLDSLRALAPGLDENDSQHVEAALRPVVRLAQRTGKAILILHHAGKSGVEYRGSTAIGAAVELGFTLSRHEDDPERATRRRLTCWKCRPAPEPPTRWIKLGVNAAGRILVDEAEPYEPERDAPVRDALVGDLREHIGGVLVYDPLGASTPVHPPSWTTADLARAINRDPKDRYVRVAAERLADEGVIYRGEDNRWHPQPRLPGFDDRNGGSHDAT